MGHGELRWTETQPAAGGATTRSAGYGNAVDRPADVAIAREGGRSGAVRLRDPRVETRGDSRADVRVTDDERARFLDIVLGADETAPTRFVDALRDGGVEISTVYLELLGPTAVSLGDMWVEDTCDFFDVTVAVGRLQRVVRELGQAFVATSPGTAPAGRVLLSCLPGDQHTLGMYMVAEFLLRDGWGVRVGTPVTADELAAVLRDEWFDVVGFSAACDVRLLALRHEVAAVRRHSRNPDVRVLVGGRVFVEHPELAARVGADAFATSAEDAPDRARALLGSRAS